MYPINRRSVVALCETWFRHLFQAKVKNEGTKAHRPATFAAQNQPSANPPQSFMRVHSDLSQLPDFHHAVVTIGSFDGVHSGHRRILEQVQALARECGGESVVVTFDPHPRTVLRPDDHSFRLITTTAEKIALLGASGIDHIVVVPFSENFSQQSAREYVEDFLLKKFSPRYIVIGYDHRFGHDREGDLDFLKKYEAQANFQVVEIPAQVVDDLAVSSSQIRKALEISDIEHANRLLGHPFSFTGTVVKGKQIGRTIGFPTANVMIDDAHKLRLPEGIYAAHASSPTIAPTQKGRGDEAYTGAYTSAHTSPPLPVGVGPQRFAMLYIGNRPTIEGENAQTIEVNILDFDGDLYGQMLTVDVMDFIRPDKKLDSLEALKAQIEEDKKEILGRLKVEGGGLKVEGAPSTLYPLP